MQEDHRHAGPMLVNCYKLPACDISRNDSLQAPSLSLLWRSSFRVAALGGMKFAEHDILLAHQTLPSTSAVALTPQFSLGMMHALAMELSAAR